MAYKEIATKHKETIPGLVLTDNSQGHRVVYLHYTANPVKAKPEWIGAQSAKYMGGLNSLQWRREYEIDFKAGSGELVFPEFPALEDELVIDETQIPDFENFLKRLTLFGGLDWGIRNPVAFLVFGVDPEGGVYVMWEYYRKGNETNVFEVSRIIRENPYYDRMQTIFYDPSMNKEDQQRKDGLTSIIRMFQEEVPEKDQIGILATAHDRNDMLAVSIIRNLLSAKKLRAFRTCSNWIDEIRNLKYPERKENINEPEKLLDKNNHAWDATKYFILSHPTAEILREKPKFGTIGYLNIVSERAREISKETGQSYQSVFNDLYGKELYING